MALRRELARGGPSMVATEGQQSPTPGPRQKRCGKASLSLNPLSPDVWKRSCSCLQPRCQIHSRPAPGQRGGGVGAGGKATFLVDEALRPARQGPMWMTQNVEATACPGTTAPLLPGLPAWHPGPWRRRCKQTGDRGLLTQVDTHSTTPSPPLSGPLVPVRTVLGLTHSDRLLAGTGLTMDVPVQRPDGLLSLLHSGTSPGGQHGACGVSWLSSLPLSSGSCRGPPSAGSCAP